MAKAGAVPSAEGWIDSSDWLVRARRLGPLRYSDLGRRRLEPTEPGETGALASWIASTADAWWDRAGRPDPYTLVVVSGDGGRLAATTLASGPRCAGALRYVLVNPDHAGRSGPPDDMARLVDLEEPAYLYPAAPSPVTPGPSGDHESTDDELDAHERPAARGIGPLATFLTEVPSLGETPGAVIAVGVLSRLPYDLYEWVDGSWCEVRVAAGGDGLVEIDVPEGQPGTPGGPPPHPPRPSLSRWRRMTGAVGWMRRHLPTAEAGHLAVVDRWEGPGDTESVDLAQLRGVREPLDAKPRPVQGTTRSVVTWRLG